MRLLLNQAASLATTRVVRTVTVAPTAVSTVFVAITNASVSTTRVVLTMTVAPTAVPRVIVVGESGCSFRKLREQLANRRMLIRYESGSWVMWIPSDIYTTHTVYRP